MKLHKPYHLTTTFITTKALSYLKMFKMRNLLRNSTIKFLNFKSSMSSSKEGKLEMLKIILVIVPNRLSLTHKLRRTKLLISWFHCTRKYRNSFWAITLAIQAKSSTITFIRLLIPNMVLEILKTIMLLKSNILKKRTLYYRRRMTDSFTMTFKAFKQSWLKM